MARSFRSGPLAAGVLLAGALLALGLAVHRDYGVPWDEPTQRGYARTVARYVSGGDERLLSDPDRAYGPAHELLLLAAETVAHARDLSEIVAVRRIVNYSVFLAGVGFLYALARLGTGSRAVALVASAALVLSPLQFAHAFYNSKDLPFLAAFVASMFTLLKWTERPAAGTTAAHVAASAWLIAVRVPGLLVVVLTIGMAAYGALRPRGLLPRRHLAWAAIYVPATAILAWALWPTLWRDPLASFQSALQTMARFPWGGEVLYRGRFVPAADLPWHYVPVWIAITTPLLYLAGFVAGVPVVVRSIVHELRGPTTVRGRYHLLLAAWLLLPPGSVIVLGSVLYDGWRQLFFVYPALLLIAVEGVWAAGRGLAARRERAMARLLLAAGAAAVVIATLGIVSFMIRSHPHQHVFFNALAGGPAGARFRFEMDYWGVAYRQGLQAILARDPDPLIPIAVADPPGLWNLRALPYPERRRLRVVDSPDQARYFVGTYRLRNTEYPFPDVIHREQVEGATILSVAAVHPGLTLTPESVPDVARVRDANHEELKAIPDDRLQQVLGELVRGALASFVRGADTLDVQISGSLPELREGWLRQLQVTVRRGEIGDLRRGRDAVPVEALDLTLDGSVMDVRGLREGTFRPALLRRIAVNELVIGSEGLNAALQRSRGEAQRLRVRFDGGAIHVEHRGRMTTEAAVRLWVAPDPWKPGSENLYFELTSLRAGGWPVPAAWLLQRIVGDYFSPVLGPDQFDGELSLGSVAIDGGKLVLGRR